MQKTSTHLFLVLSPGGVQRLNERSRMTHEHSETGSAHNHAEDGEPHVSHADGGVQAIPDAQHVTHGLEEGVGVLLTPSVILEGTKRRRESSAGFTIDGFMSLFQLPPHRVMYSVLRSLINKLYINKYLINMLIIFTNQSDCLV